MTFVMHWFDALALNESAKIVFDTQTMTVQYFATARYHNTPSPRWHFTYDRENKIINIPVFRYRRLNRDEWAHDISASWFDWHFRCYAPYTRILIIPEANVILDNNGPDLSRMEQLPPPVPPPVRPVPTAEDGAAAPPVPPPAPPRPAPEATHPSASVPPPPPMPPRRSDRYNPYSRPTDDTEIDGDNTDPTDFV